MKNIIIALAALAVSISGAAAQDSGLTQSESPTLAGTEWLLVSITDEGVTTPVEGEITLAFTGEEQFSGSGGCNSYNGTVEIAPDSITFGNVISTRMACADDNQTAQESLYFNLLPLVNVYQFSGNRLTLSTADARTLQFTAHGAYGLIGSEWTLDAYGSLDLETETTGTDLPRLEFVSDTELSAFGGCNGYGSTYTTDGENLTIEQGVGTLIACEPEIMAQEAAYFDLLPQVVRYEISGSTLMLYTEDGQFLRFTAAGEYALTRVTWQLAMISSGDAGNPPVDGTNITIDFRPDGTVSGSAGCNQFSGGYTVEGESLVFDEIVSTLMACAGDAMAQESRFFEILGAVERYQIADGSLSLFDGGTTSLLFQPVGDPPMSDEA